MFIPRSQVGGTPLPSWWVVDSAPGYESVNFGGRVIVAPTSMANQTDTSLLISGVMRPLDLYPTYTSGRSIKAVPDNGVMPPGYNGPWYYRLYSTTGPSGQGAFLNLMGFTVGGTYTGEFETGSDGMYAIKYVNSVATWYADWYAGYGTTFYGAGTQIKMYHDYAGSQKKYFFGDSGSGVYKFGIFGKGEVVQQSHLADPSGGATIDAEARTTINAILDALEAYGWLALS